MRLADLIEEELEVKDTSPEITGLTADSRAVGPGYLFAALPGAKADGRAFIDQAVRQGAVAVLVPFDTPDLDPGVPVIRAGNARQAFAEMAARFHGLQPEMTAAVTGTNGKTSVVSFARQLWALLGLNGASLGTIGVHAPGVDITGSLTTPDPSALHETLARLARAGIDHLAMEASSHGLAQYRLDGVDVRAAAFTNLSRDHLDYHGSMEAYLAAKLRLFTEVLADDGFAVLNADIPEYQTLADACAARDLPILDYGRDGTSLRLIDAAPDGDGQRLTLSVLGTEHALTLPLAGAFQAMNALAALGLVLSLGADPGRTVPLLAKLTGVPGRLQRVATTDHGASIYVDYAHTPDALRVALEALRPHAAGRLVVVFGAGGDRDTGKRAPMGRVAADCADLAIVTDDNPRTEDAAVIRAQVMLGCPKALEIGDRGRAIRHAVGLLEPGDLLVLAGKGHETGQIVGAETLPFDDADEARRAVEDLS